MFLSFMTWGLYLWDDITYLRSQKGCRDDFWGREVGRVMEELRRSFRYILRGFGGYLGRGCSGGGKGISCRGWGCVFLPSFL